MAARTTASHWIMWLVTDSLETDGIQGDVWFLGADCHKLEKEFPVVSGQTRQQTLRVIRVELT